MTEIFIVALAVAGVLSAIDEFIKPMGKLKGLVALGASIGGLLSLGTKMSDLPVYGLSVTFLALVMTLTLDKVFASDSRSLPRRVPRL